jgi:hypothetical protein
VVKKKLEQVVGVVLVAAAIAVVVAVAMMPGFRS